METIKRKNGFSYREKIYVNGRPITKVFKRKTDATRWKREQLANRDRIAIYGAEMKPDIRFSVFLTSWIQTKRNEYLAPRSIESYQSIIRLYLKPLFGHRKLTTISYSDTELLLSTLAKKNLGPKRINNILTVLKMILEDATKNDYLLKNPLIRLKKVKLPQKEKTFWCPSEIATFLQANKDTEEFWLYQIALNTGMRRGELLGLCWDAVNLSKREIEIKRQLDRYGLKNNTKSRKPRTIQINASTLQALKILKEEQRNDTFVFTKKDGSLYNISHFGSRVFQKAIARAGVKKIRFHDLRTTFACNWCINGGNIFALSKILGHSSVQITQQSYADLSPEFLSKVAGTVDFSLDSPDLAHKHLALI